MALYLKDIDKKLTTVETRAFIMFNYPRFVVIKHTWMTLLNYFKNMCVKLRCSAISSFGMRKHYLKIQKRTQTTYNKSSYRHTNNVPTDFLAPKGVSCHALKYGRLILEHPAYNLNAWCFFQHEPWNYCLGRLH